MNFRPQNAVKKQIGADIVRLGLDNGAQIQHGTHAAAPRCRARFHRMIGLRGAIGKDRIAPLILGVLEKIFKLSQLVSAYSKAGEIVSLKIEVDSQVLGNVLQIVNLSRKIEKAAADTREDMGL